MITIHSSSLYLQPSANAIPKQPAPATDRADPEQAQNSSKSDAINLPSQQQIQQALERSGLATGNQQANFGNPRISKALASYNQNRNQPALSEFHSLIPEIDLYA